MVGREENGGFLTDFSEKRSFPGRFRIHRMGECRETYQLGCGTKVMGSATLTHLTLASPVCVIWLYLELKIFSYAGN